MRRNGADWRCHAAFNSTSRALFIDDATEINHADVPVMPAILFKDLLAKNRKPYRQFRRRGAVQPDRHMPRGAAGQQQRDDRGFFLKLSKYGVLGLLSRFSFHQSAFIFRCS